MDKVLITGINSLLGVGLAKTAPKKIKLLGTWHKNKPKFIFNNILISHLDITNHKQVLALFKQHKPRLVIHLAAMSDIDKCEKNKSKAKRLNIEGTKNIINACKKYHAKFVFSSSSMVFDGAKQSFSEKHRPNPINYYGKTKYHTEQEIIKTSLSFLIIRSTTLFGWNPVGTRDNPATWAISKLSNNQPIKVVNDYHANPIYNLTAAKAFWRLINTNKTGIYHIAGADVVSRFQMIKLIAKVFDLNETLVTPISSNALTNFAPRPPMATLQTNKIQKELKIIPQKLIAELQKMKRDKPVYA